MNISCIDNHEKGSILLEGVLIFPIYLLLLIFLFHIGNVTSAKSRLAVLENTALWDRGNRYFGGGIAAVKTFMNDAGAVILERSEVRHWGNGEGLVLHRGDLVQRISLKNTRYGFQEGEFAFQNVAASGNFELSMYTRSDGSGKGAVIMRTSQSRDISPAGLLTNARWASLTGSNTSSANNNSQAQDYLNEAANWDLFAATCLQEFYQSGNNLYYARYLDAHTKAMNCYQRAESVGNSLRYDRSTILTSCDW